MEKNLKNLIKKSKRYYDVGIHNPNVGTKNGKVEIFSDRNGYIIFKWENSLEFIAFFSSKKVEQPAMSFDGLTICKEENVGVYSFNDGTDWEITICE